MKCDAHSCKQLGADIAVISMTARTTAQRETPNMTTCTPGAYCPVLGFNVRHTHWLLCLAGSCSAPLSATIPHGVIDCGAATTSMLSGGTCAVRCDTPYYPSSKTVACVDGTLESATCLGESHARAQITGCFCSGRLIWGFRV